MTTTITRHPIICLPNVPRTRVVHMSRVLAPESKGEWPEYLQGVIVHRARAVPLVILREDLEGNEP